jgi:putative membrane protein
MKWTGFGALACAVMFTIACAGDARDDRGDDADRSAAAGTSGADTNQSAGFDNDNDANDGADLNMGRDAQARSGAGADEGQTRIGVGTSGQSRTATQGTMHGASGDARHFAQMIAMHNTAEIQLGQLASERAQSPEVKQFAQQMVRDHTRAGNELKQAVSGQNVDLNANEMDQKHEQLMARLRGLRGAEFDREYMKAMVEGHNEVRSLLESRAGAGQSARTNTGSGATGTTGTRPNTAGTSDAKTQLDTAVNQWANKTLPTVQQHLQKAEQIHGKVEGGSRGANTRSGSTGTAGNTGNDNRR